MEKLTVISLIVLAVLLTSIIWYASTNTRKTIPANSTASPTSTLSPTSTSTPPNIGISYTYQTVQNISTAPSGPYMFGFNLVADSGNKFLEVNMTIKNNGYVNGFDTNASYFSVLANNLKCFFNASYSNILGWGFSTTTTTYSTNGSPIINIATNYVHIPNGGSFNGTLVFQVPKSSTAFVIDYQQPTSNSLNIIWTKT